MTPTPDRKELDDLKARVDLVELFRRYGLEPQKKGKSWLCLCPFHPDDKASLSISPERGLWRCFGCKAAGDGFDFLRLKEKLEFPAALAVLQSGGPALDAVETGIRAVEQEPSVRTVGVGGAPNRLGEMELDASIMEGGGISNCGMRMCHVCSRIKTRGIPSA